MDFMAGMAAFERMMILSIPTQTARKCPRRTMRLALGAIELRFHGLKQRDSAPR
jgi:hypothetical protein